METIIDMTLEVCKNCKHYEAESCEVDYGTCELCGEVNEHSECDDFESI